jgi:hypothetical protein
MKMVDTIIVMSIQPIDYIIVTPRRRGCEKSDETEE